MLPLLSGIVGYSHLNATTYSCQYIFANSRLAIPKTGLPLLFPLSRFFVGYDEELLELTTLGMKLYSLSFLLCGFNIFGSAFFTALNNGIVSAVISFLRTLVFQVTAILVLPHLLGMNGIWLSVVAAEIAALFVNAFFLVKNRKKYQY